KKITDQHTGKSRREPRSELWLQLCGKETAAHPPGADVWLRQLGTLQTADIVREPGKQRHGGYRPPPCPDHPQAAVIQYRVYCCAECRRPLGQSQIQERPLDATDLTVQDPMAAVGLIATSVPTPLLTPLW